MARSTTHGRRLRGAAASFLVLLTCGGCATKVLTPDAIRVKTETEVAIAAIQAEWLQKCTLEKAAISNSVGALLQDYVDLAEQFAVCSARHNELVMYLSPVVRREKAK